MARNLESQKLTESIDVVFLFVSGQACPGMPNLDLDQPNSKTFEAPIHQEESEILN